MRDLTRGRKRTTTFSAPPKKTIPKESDDQKILVKWLHTQPVLFFAIPNDNATSYLNRHKSIQSELRARALGKSKGVPDLVIMAKGKMPLFLELKRVKGGRLSDAQKRWHEDLRAYGHLVVVAHGLDQAIGLVKKYLQGLL